MRKVWAAIAGVFLLWTSSVLAPSATAHDGHTDWFKWREPEDNTDVSGQKVTLRAKVHLEEGIRRWTLNVLPPDGYATVHTWGVVCESPETDKKPKTVEIVCEWDTTTYPDGTQSRNHAYRARVSAWNDKPSPAEGGEGSEESEDEAGTTTTTTSTTSTTSGTDPEASDGSGSSTTTTTEDSTTTTRAPAAPANQVHHSPVRTLVVANPPSAPNGVTLAFDKKASQAKVSWDPNPEPDIAHYLVEERFKNGDWSLVAKTTDTSWTGRLDEKGTYRFRVAAVRYVGSQERLKEGPRREPQSGMRKVENDPEEATSGSTPPESSAGKRKDQDEEDRKKRQENDATPESTTTTAPPDSVVVAFDGTGDPGSTPTPAGAGNGSAPSNLAPIEPGSPGSVQTRYADPPRLPAPVSPEQAYDPGFSLALPYPKEVRLDIGPPPEAPPRLLGTVALFDSNEDQRRALVGVLAGGLVVFMVSMQAAYLNRRPRPIDLAASADWD